MITFIGMDELEPIIFSLIAIVLMVSMIAVAVRKGGEVKFRKLDDSRVDQTRADVSKKEVKCEGQRMIRHKETPMQVMEDEKSETPAGRIIDIDKKKLIIYSEIMKPKFDQ